MPSVKPLMPSGSGSEHKKKGYAFFLGKHDEPKREADSLPYKRWVDGRCPQGSPANDGCLSLFVGEDSILPLFLIS